jgi:hypothetical protein
MLKIRQNIGMQYGWIDIQTIEKANKYVWIIKDRYKEVWWYLKRV